MFGIDKLADHIVIEKLKQGDEEILVYLYKQYFTLINSFVLRNSGDVNAAEDLVQDTIIAVWKNANKPSFILQSKLSTYVMAITKNLWFKELKKRTKFQLVDESRQLWEETEPNISNIDQRIIVSLIAQMDDTCRKLLSYFYFDGLSTQSIAKKLQFANTNTVKSKKYQCFKKLQTSVMSQYQKEDFL